MKPSEIIPISELSELSLRGHSKTLKTLGRYFNKDCVVSYAKNSLGVIFLIKGKVKPFAFAYIDKVITPYYYTITMIDELTDYFNLYENIKLNETKELVSEDLLKRVKAKIMLQEIKA